MGKYTTSLVAFIWSVTLCYANETPLSSMAMTLDQSIDPALSLPDDSKETSNPIRKMAKDFRSTIKTYREQRQLAKNRGEADRYDHLLKEAEAMIKEMEEASMQHDAYMAKYQEGDITSGAQAIRLAEIIRAQSQPFQNILLRMNQVIKTTGIIDMVGRPYHKKFELTPRSAPPTRFMKNKTEGIKKPANGENEENEPVPVLEGRAKSLSPETEIDHGQRR